MASDYWLPVAYAAPMPAEDKATLYLQQIKKLLATINNLKGITEEVRTLKRLATTVEITVNA